MRHRLLPWLSLVFLLQTLPASAAEQLMPGESRQPFADSARGIALAEPKDHPMIFRTSHFAQGQDGAVCEFRFTSDNFAPTVSGVLMRHDSALSAKEYADQRQGQIDKSPNFEKCTLLKESTLDRKPGQWLLREFKLEGKYGAMLEQHLFIADGTQVVELMLHDNFRAADTSRPVMEQVIAGLSVNVKPTTRAVKGVAGLAYSSSGKGKWLDIYVLKEGESKPVNITDNPYMDHSPAWSPDGTQIAFVSGRNSDTRDAGSTCGIYVMNSDGSDVRWIVHEDARFPRWSPDGKQIVFQAGDRAVATVNADGTGMRVVAAGQYPSWAPDGRILYTGGEGLCLINADGTNQSVIVRSLRIDELPVFGRYSPDGKQIIFTGKQWGDVAMNEHAVRFGAVMTCNPDGTNLHFIHLNNAGLPCFLPKMNKIAFMAPHGGDYVSSGHSLDVFVKNVDEVPTLNLTAKVADIYDYDMSPLVSDDPLPKKKIPCDIVFSRSSLGPAPTGTATGNGQCDLFVMTEDGKDLTNITQTETHYCREDNPCWSPDKKKIAFESNQPYWIDGQNKGNYDISSIWTINADGSHRVNLTPSGTSDHEPQWSPDGTQIAFLRGFPEHLMIMNADGTKVRDLGGDLPLRHFSWSADGSMVIFGTGSWPTTVTPNTDPPVWNRLTNKPQTDRWDPDWNPTSDAVAFFGNSPKGKYSLMQFNFPGGADEVLQEIGGGITTGPCHPSWGPDGCRIAFQSGISADLAGSGGGVGRGDIVIADIRHSDPKDNVNLTTKFGGGNYEPDWAAGPSKYRHPPTVAGGGNCIVVCCKVADGFVLYMLKTDGSDVKEVGRIKADRFMDEPPNLCASGRRAAAASIVNGKGKILICDLDGKESRAVADGIHPCLSPDGSHLAFLAPTGSQPSAPNELYILDLDHGGRPVHRPGKSKPSYDGDDPYMAWSADGKLLYFASEFAAAAGAVTETLYSLSADGTNLKPICEVPARHTFRGVHPSPDGKNLVMLCPLINQNEIYACSADGGAPKNILEGCYLPLSCWSQDSQRIFAVSAPSTLFSCNADGSDARKIMDAGFSYGHWNVRGDKALILGPAPGGGQGLFVCGADGANPNWLNKVKGEVVAAVWCARMD